MNSEVFISDTNFFEKTVQSIIADGPDRLHILADFDKTITCASVDGVPVNSMIALLRDEKHLTPDYAEKAQMLADRYHPIEIDPDVPREEKKAAMNEWWRKHAELLVQSGLTKRDIEKVIHSQRLKLRDGSKELLELAHEQGIPFVIMSASGLGIEPILMYLEKEGIPRDRVHAIGNYFEWDEHGNAVRLLDPIIHSLIKAETSVKQFPVYDLIKDRTNVILLGDNAHDVDMIEGFDYGNLITIGFLHKEIDKRLGLYQKLYDVVLTGDADMWYVVDLVKRITPVA